jgi:2-oxoisovalerate dehydrogenase E1 component alpha subunit
MWALRRQGRGHFAVPHGGHEAIGAGIGLALRPGLDYVAGHYRDLGIFLAFGLTPREVMAHYFGRAADPCAGGRQPYNHWGSRERHILSLEGPQPNQVSHGVGFAYAVRQLGEEGVVWVGFGDGGAQKGEVHEAMNFAAVHRLPVVFCVENNGYTQSVPLSLESSVADLSCRAAGYGMPGISVDGMQLAEVFSAACEAIERARAGQGPSLIEARCYRYLPNTSNDDDSRYRPREEVEEARKRDPIVLLRAKLPAALADAIDEEAMTEAAAAAEWAEAQPDADPSTVMQHTYA